MAEVEHCCHLHTLPKIPPTEYQRLYFGAEFCFWRFPIDREILEAIDWCREAGWGMTLVTPTLNQSELSELGSRLERVLPQFGENDELVVSDWGGIDLVGTIRSDLTLIIGRVLSAQKRDPRIESLALNLDDHEYFRNSIWNSRPSAELLLELGISRVELDNLVQGVVALPKSLKGSLHLPYAMVTSTRNCPFRSTPVNQPCPAPCGELFRLKSNDGGQPLLQAGNTQFFENHQVPERLLELGIDRLVHHPQLPH
ncbi:MAG: hypothetical protein C0614_10250 [Desulfuromonas sp.]|nr:MAG: hypothetical protein C0614_10250 [Desulfuromonas sp.]